MKESFVPQDFLTIWVVGPSQMGWRCQQWSFKWATKFFKTGTNTETRNSEPGVFGEWKQIRCFNLIISAECLHMLHASFCIVIEHRFPVFISLPFMYIYKYTDLQIVLQDQAMWNIWHRGLWIITKNLILFSIHLKAKNLCVRNKCLFFVLQIESISKGCQ